MPPLLRLDKISLSYGSRPLLDAVTLQLEQGERVALIGRNGEGKSSLLRVLRAEIEPDAGHGVGPAGARVALLPQDVLVAEPVTISEWVAGSLTASPRGDRRVRWMPATPKDGPIHAAWPPYFPGCNSIRPRASTSSPAARGDAHCWRGRWWSNPRSCYSTSRPIISI